MNLQTAYNLFETVARNIIQQIRIAPYDITYEFANDIPPTAQFKLNITHNGTVISYIMCDITYKRKKQYAITTPSGIVLEIDSSTALEYRNNKLNLLLSAIVIHIAATFASQLAPLAVWIKSAAVNPVSLYTLAKYFTGVQILYIDVNPPISNDALYYIHQNLATVILQQPLSYQSITTLYDHYKPQHEIIANLYVPADTTNNERATHIINTLTMRGRN